MHIHIYIYIIQVKGIYDDQLYMVYLVMQYPLYLQRPKMDYELLKLILV